MLQTAHIRSDLEQIRPLGPSAGSGIHTDRIPLVLDLDQTLLRSDLLFESAFSLLRDSPLNAFRMIAWALKGKAHLKRKVAETARIDPASLPINEDVAAFAADRKAAGQTIVVATASDEEAARKLMVRFPFVDEVIGSDGVRNLKGEAKARLLQMRYPQGFDYAGDSSADLQVWKVCSSIILVEPTAAVARAAAKIKVPERHLKNPRLSEHG